MFSFKCLSLTTSMLFLPNPPYNGNCYKIGTRHAREVSLGSCKVGISVGGWGILQKTCDLALKITKNIYTLSANCVT